MPEIPREPVPDSTLALLADPYDFIRERARANGADLFQTRILLQPTICMTGPDAAELFYDQGRFQRSGAAPDRLQKTLFGEGGVQGLDGQAHRHRKAMLLEMATDGQVEDLVDQFVEVWRAKARLWALSDRVVLYEELREVLTRAVCRWAGVPLDEDEVEARTGQLSALFEHAGDVGPAHWWARVARWSGDRWGAGLVEAVRNGALRPDEGTALHTVAWHRDREGERLAPRVAGVELLNLLRPTVAVAVYATFVAHALHVHEAEAARALHAGPEGEERFVQEVRRWYPFFPAVAARVRRDFQWRGYAFPQGTRVLLDLYGTNRDPRAWDEPEAFRPERFRGRQEDLFTFIPQGGGQRHTHHRCVGEPATVALMQATLECLTEELTYDVPTQDLSIDRSRLPALPRSRFVVEGVRPSPAEPRRTLSRPA